MALYFSYVIPNGKLAFARRVKKNQDEGKAFYSISVKYQNVGHMIHVY